MKAANAYTGARHFFRQIRAQWELCLIAAPFLVYIILFSYIPLWGLTMAFQDFKPQLSFFQQAWVGFGQFQKLFKDVEFLQVIRNTMAMGVINLVLQFVTAIAFALLLNELVSTKFRRLAQTVSYMPHFLSWIIVTGLVANMLSLDDGILNELLLKSGLIQQKIHFLGEPKYFWWIVGWSHVWKELGWNSIIYLAAITAIDPALYEAAAIDGCGRFRRNLHITLPGIKSTIIILFIMNIGWILNVGFEVPYLLGANGVVQDVSWTIDIYVVRRGFGRSNGYSIATAAGLFKTVISVTLISVCNWLSGRFGEERLI